MKEEEIKYALGNQDIDTSFITIEMTWKGLLDKRIKEQIGMLMPNSLCNIIEGTTMNFYVDASKLEKFVDICSSTLLNNKELREELKQKTINVAKEMKEFTIKHIEKADSFSEQEIANLLIKIRRLQSECAMLGTVVAFADIYGEISNKLAKILDNKQNLKHPTHIYSQVLGNPFEKSLTEQAYDDIKNSGKSSEELLKEYFWLDQGYIGRGLTLKHLKEIKKEQEKQENSLPSAQELLDKLELPPEEEKVFQVSRDLIQIKSLRADIRQFLHVLTNKLVDNLSAKLNIESRYLEALYTEEICDIINKKIQIPSNLKERWKYAALITNKKDKYTILLGKQAEEFSCFSCSFFISFKCFRVRPLPIYP